MPSEDSSRGDAGTRLNSKAVATPQREHLEGMRIFWLLSLLLVLPVTAQAQQVFPEHITTEQAVREALEKNLGLLAERYNLSIADARIITARLRPNPVFSFGADYLDWVGAKFSPTMNLGPSEVNFRTDFVFERGGKRQRRIEVAENARAMAQLQFLDATRTLMLDVQEACVEVLLAKESLLLAQENMKAFDGIVSVNSARVSAGDLAKVELVRSQVAALQFQNAVLQAEARLRIARNRLQALLGRLTPSPSFDVVDELRRETQSWQLEELRQQALELRPDLQALVKDQARSVADLRLQQAQGKVDYTVGAQIHRQYGEALSNPGNSLGIFFSLPLPVFNRNQGEIERARQEQQQIESKIKALQVSIRNEIDNAYLQYLAARDLLSRIEPDMLQQAREVRQTTEYSYRRGEASFVELLDAQRAFNDTMQSYNEARAEFARSLYLIDSISGKAVHQ
jgi:cobalt-zinc-cadmium efflux system outer membrane protein